MAQVEKSHEVSEMTQQLQLHSNAYQKFANIGRGCSTKKHDECIELCKAVFYCLLILFLICKRKECVITAFRSDCPQ